MLDFHILDLSATAINIMIFLILLIVALKLLKSFKGNSKDGSLEVTNLTEEYIEDSNVIAKALGRKKDTYKLIKDSPTLFVIDFKGSITLENEMEPFRREVSSVIDHAIPNTDEVLIRLESGGGTVTGYGLAAAQIQRFKSENIKVTVAIDEIAASGGYLMACVADKVIASPFALIGSIGVAMEFANFYELLNKLGIKFKSYTAGEYKRTVTPFADTDEKGEKKLKEDLEVIHNLFKDFVSEHRPNVDIESVATGECWQGADAKSKKLIDEVAVSDDYIMKFIEDAEVLKVTYKVENEDGGLISKLVTSTAKEVTNKLEKLLSSSQLYK